MGGVAKVLHMEGLHMPGRAKVIYVDKGHLNTHISLVLGDEKLYGRDIRPNSSETIWPKNHPEEALASVLHSCQC